MIFSLFYFVVHITYSDYYLLTEKVLNFKEQIKL